MEFKLDDNKRWMLEKIVFPLAAFLVGGVLAGIVGYFMGQVELQKSLSASEQRLNSEIITLTREVARLQGNMDGVEELRASLTSIAKAIGGMNKELPNLNKKFVQYKETIDLAQTITPETRAAIKQFVNAENKNVDVLGSISEQLVAINAGQFGAVSVQQGLTLYHQFGEQHNYTDSPRWTWSVDESNYDSGNHGDLVLRVFTDINDKEGEEVLRVDAKEGLVQ